MAKPIREANEGRINTARIQLAGALRISPSNLSIKAKGEGKALYL